MGHLDDLYENYKDKGLVVLAVTNEGRGLVDSFVSATGAKHPIVIETGDSSSMFGIKGFPTSFLVGPDGKIAWTGHPASIKEEDIKRLLLKVRLVPELPRKLSSVQKSMEKSDFAGAMKTLEKELAGDTLDDDVRKAAEETVKWINDKAASMLADADTDGQAGDWYEAHETLQKVVDSFKGLEPAEKAKEMLDGILKDKRKKGEVKAGEVYEKTKEKVRSMKPEQAAQIMRSLAKKYDGTKAGEKALSDAIKLEAQARR